MHFLFLLPYLLQLILIIHIIKTRQDFTWLWLLVFLPYIGGLAYLILVFIPSLRSSQGLHSAGDAIVNKVQPNRRLTELEKLVRRQETIANKVLLADAYTSDGRYEQALEIYDSCLSGAYENDPEISYKRAVALYESGKKEEAKIALEQLCEKVTFSEPSKKLFIAKVNEDYDFIKEMFFDQSNFEAGFIAASYFAQHEKFDEVSAIVDEMKDILQTYRYLRKMENNFYYKETKKLLK
ncbi:MAG: tetratricopeptide repeat protein [Treponema sp.]|nr:tetratricopeptide repeat protein [Treponema sp.]